jgi:polyphosphate kinase 2 (PPK2 family)
VIFHFPERGETDEESQFCSRDPVGRWNVVDGVRRRRHEDVLIARVHKLVPKERWSHRYDRINAFEIGLVEDDTHILKFFLHISKGEQLKRFKDRLDDPTKQWKISEADYKERTCWDGYTAAYENPCP